MNYSRHAHYDEGTCVTVWLIYVFFIVLGTTMELCSTEEYDISGFGCTDNTNRIK